MHRVMIHKKSRWVLPVALFFGFLLSTCSFEKSIDELPVEPVTILNPATYIVPSMLTGKGDATRGMPIDTVTQMIDFGFFCSYSNLSDWDASIHTPAKMFNRKMLPYYDLTHPYPDVLLWKYAVDPAVEWAANTAADHYSFFGYGPFATDVYHATTNPAGNGIVVTSTSSSAGLPTLSYVVPSKVENQPDLMLAEPVYDLVPTGHPVQLQMNHALTAIGFRIAGGNSEKITNLSVTGVYISGTLEMDGSNIDWTLTGSITSADFSASINFDSGQSYRTVTTSLVNPLKDDGWLMMPPQILEPTAKVKIAFNDGTTRDVSLANYAITEWEAGKRILYDIFVTPAGSISVIPNHTVLPYMAQCPAAQHITVVCELFDGNPDPAYNWTLTVPPSEAHWLQLSLNTTGYGASSTVSGTGTQTVYLVTLSDYFGTTPPRSANLSLDGGVTTAAVVSQSALPGPSFNGWLYVRQGAIGSGLNWNDAAPTIIDALTSATLLETNGYTVHGILVAGGSGRLYAENFVLLDNLKVFGGWEGISGTELPNDPTAPYTSVHRDLTRYKAVLTSASTSLGVVTLAGAGTALDGFIIQGVTGPSLVTVSNGAYINAVEIKNNTATTGYVLTVSGTGALASNVLVSNNTGDVILSTGGTLLNGTVVDNNGVVSCASAMMINTIAWRNSSMTFLGTNTIEHCAFPTAFVPSTGVGNVALDPANNTAWFTPVNVIPGPHFNFNTIISRPQYMALNDRAPMLGRGNQALFDTNTPFLPGPAGKTDINGNPRHYLGTDMGCYEDQVYEGFKMRWASDRVYISSKDNTVNQIPLLIPENSINQIGVVWSITVNPGLSFCTFNGPFSGSGTGVLIDILTITTNGNYNAGAERLCGSFTIHTNLGGYLADTEVEIWQVPGTSALWENGYVGSFHRNNETSERYITGENSYATFVNPPPYGTSSPTTKGYYQYWSARIVSGLDWIKVDTNPKGYNGGEVVETYGGVVSGATPTNGDPIRFRVGLKSTLPPGAPPRYGLIVISRGNSPNLFDGATWFFVRQGEEADYVYRPTNVPGVTGDPKSTSVTTRLFAKKYLPYNVIAPSSVTMANGGVDVRSNPGNPSIAVPVSHPTKIGDFFQRNRTTAYRRSVQTSALPNNYLTSATTWIPGQDVCPSGYRHPTYPELFESLYLNLTPGGTPPNYTSAGGDNNPETMRGFMWGYYADGYFDQNAPDPVVPGNAGSTFVGTQPNVAAKGTLMVNHANFASLFFPMAGTMTYNGPSNVGQSYNINNLQIDGVWVPSLFVGQLGVTGMYPTTYWNPGSLPTGQTYGSTHWVSGHVGLACTSITGYAATNIRCVKDE